MDMELLWITGFWQVIFMPSKPKEKCIDYVSTPFTKKGL